MIAVLINRPISKEEIHEVEFVLKRDSSAIVYTTSNITLPFPAEVVVQDTDLKKRANHDAMAGILGFGEIEAEGISITERLTINGMSLWHYHKFRIYFLLSNLLSEVDIMRDYSARYDQVIWYTSGPDPSLLTLIPSNVSIKLARNPKGKSKMLLSKFYYFVYVSIRFIQGVVASKKTNKVKHLFIDRSARQSCLDLNDLSIKKENYNLAYLFAKADKDFAIIDEIEIPKFINGQPFRIERWMLSNTRKHLLRIPGEYILLSAFFHSSVRRNSKEIKQRLLASVSELVKLYPSGQTAWILKQLHRFHRASELYIYKKQAYDYFFKDRNFLSISTIDENSPNVKSILDSARLHNIQTVGIQHGIIHDLHPAYVITPQDIKRKILYDKFIVWGQNWKQYMMRKIGYPENMLFIAGQPRTDIIPVLLNEHQKLSAKLQLPDKDIIVFASQPLRDKMIRERAAFDVFTTVSGMDNVHLVIKLHPAEINESDYYNKIAAQIGCTNYSIVLDTDLYLVIASCTLLITISSTVGAETIYFGKPLIILDHLNEDLLGYVKQRVAFKATNQSELNEIIRGILLGDLKVDMEAYTRYIEQYAYRIDGKTSERILDIIRN